MFWCNGVHRLCHSLWPYLLVVCPCPFIAPVPPQMKHSAVCYCCYVPLCISSCRLLSCLPPLAILVCFLHIVFLKVELLGQRFYSSYYTFTSLPFVMTEPVYSAETCVLRRGQIWSTNPSSAFCYHLL